jgi:hypothetical protein
MWADGAKADGFKSMVVAQFTGVSLQKDDNAFLVYENGVYQSNATLDINSTQRPLHTNGNAIYKPDYENTHIRVSNNGFIQSVSIFAIGFAKHFVTESGGDMSITNSNSNFGAISLESTGFRNESFDRDDVGYITHIIPPKEIENIESDVTWLSLDVAKTIGVGSTSKIYLYNYKSLDIKPTHQVDSYRIGARINDNLNLTVVVGVSQTTYTSPVLMPVPSGTGVSAKKTYTVTKTGTQNNITNNTFTLSTNHQLYNGESVRVFSDTSQAPDGITVDTVYHAITTGLGTSEIKLAYSLNDAIANQPITGINNNGGFLSIVSSVTDKLPGDLGHPIQYDGSQWYITGTATTATNQIYNAIVGFGTTTLGNETASTFVKRKVDNRSIEDRIYKVRYVIPKEFENARPPQGGFILQESKTVGISTISFDNTYTLNASTPPAYLRNEKIISNATVGAVSNGTQTVTATTELPHGFIVGDKVKVQKVNSTNNPLGTGLTSTYNGSYQVISVPSTKQFTYQISGVKINPGTYTNLINERGTRQERDQLPLVSREQYTGNYFIYRVNTIKNHVPGTGGQDGIYNLTILASNVSPPTTVGYGISQKAFNQDIRNLYPQIDRDNFVVDPNEAVSYADIKTLGKVVTGDKKKSITKEAINSFVRNTRIGFGITGISTSGIAGTTITVFTDVEHTLNSLKRVSVTNVGSGYGNTTIYAANLTGGSGTNGSVRVNVLENTGTIQSVSIVDPGCAYAANNSLVVSGRIGGFDAILSVTEINNNVGDGIELSGFNQENLNGVYKILSVPSSKSFTIYNPAGVNAYTQNTNGRVPTAVLSSKGVGITSFAFSSVATGIVTVTTSPAHGLLPGNKFTIVESGHTIYDSSFFVKENVGLNTFTFYVGIVTQTKSSTTGTLLKHAISANALNLTRGEENLGSRGSYIYAGITTSLTTTVTTSSSTVGLSSAAGFNRGDYVLINAEILRLASAPSGNTFTVLRGQFSTFKTTAEVGTQVKKIKVLPMEIRRPSFLRASGHTFEYLGYGPGNYSTGMPQKQTRTLTEDDILTSQAREQAGGTVVYSAMNDLGEFYSGTKKLSSATGEEKVIDAPIITFTGDDAQGENQNRSSGIFDDVLVKERITIEGGENGNQSSQFYGPVNFTKKVTNTSDEGINTNNLYIKGTASQGKLITVGISTPTSSTIPSPKDGDISLIQPPSGGYIGQAYVNNEWKKFGLISNSADILDIKVDRLGIGDPTTFTNQNESIDATVKLYVAGKSKFEDVTFLSAPNFANGVTLNNTNFSGINILGTARFTGTSGTSYAIYVNDPVNLGSGSTAISRLYNLEVAGSAGIGTTNPITKLDVIGSSYISNKLGIGITNPTEKLEVNGNINLVSSGNYIQKTFADNTEEYILRGPALSSYYPTITYTRSTGTATRGFRFGTHDNIGNRSDWMSIWNGAVGIGTTNPTSALVVSGTIGIDGSSSTAGRTQLSSSASGFVVNHVDNSSIIFQNQSNNRLIIGVGGTITATANNSLTETRGNHLRITNSGSGDAVISWENNLGGSNKQRWYAGIDVSDNNAWKLAKPIPTDFDNENFDRISGTVGLTETKLKIDTSGNATLLGGLTLNTNKFTVAGATGNTVIAGTLNTSSNKFSVDVSGNVTADGKITGNSLEITTGTATFGSTVSVQSDVTASSFKVKDATSSTLILRANGVAAALTRDEIVAITGPIEPPTTNSTLPNGNSIQLKSIGVEGADVNNKFNSSKVIFELFTLDDQSFEPISSENLLVSVGGVIQRPGVDYEIVDQFNSASGSPRNRIRFNFVPASTLSCFIIALGGLGGLRQNLDWGADKKGYLLAGTANSNTGAFIVKGENGQVLTVDDTTGTSTGLVWKVIPRDNLKTNPAWDAKGNLLVGTGADTADILAVSTSNGAILTADSSTASGLAWKTTFDASGLTGSPNITVGTVTATSVSGNGTIPVGGIIMWSGTVAAISSLTGWALCDGTNGTPDLRERFVVGAGGANISLPLIDGGQNTDGYSVGEKSGSANATLVSHSHTATSAVTDPGHTHTSTLYNGLGSGFAGGGGQGARGSISVGSNTTGITVATSITAEGSVATNANLPPYYALAFIMRTA